MNFFNTYVSAEAIALATETLRSTFLSEGKRVAEFEHALNEQLALSFPVALNSGTSALHLALVLSGIGPNDEVILPAQTFVASALTILMCGAKPVFADIQAETGNIDPASIEKKITRRTKAIMPVHWGGYPCDMAEISELAKQHNLSVVEDAAHALGAAYRGSPIGTISRFTAFSFQAIKHVTTGDGGALSCVAETDYVRARKLRWFGIDRANSRPSVLGEREYDLDEVGYKYHLNDVGAAIGLGNLAGFPARLARRRQIARHYREAFKKIAGLQLLREEADRESAYWVFTATVERRKDFIRKLAEAQVPASVVHLRIDKNSLFGGKRDDLPNQTTFDERQVALPIHEALTDGDVEQIINIVQGGW